MAKRVLVVGGAGYIGSHVAKKLKIDRKADVLVFDDLSTGHREFLRFGKFAKGSLLNAARLQKVVRDFRPQAVLHLAASALVGESVRDPGKYYENNVVGALQLLKSLRGLKRPPAIVFSSTCAVYGEPIAPLDEMHPLNPVNPYGRSKLAIEWMLKDFHVAHGLPFVSLRYFNAAGADPEGELGEWHVPETHLIPRLLELASGKKRVKDRVEILGDDYKTPDGTCIRDYVHVTDLAEAHCLALDYLAAGGESRAFNLGSGQGHSVREVIRKVAEVTGRRLEVPVGPRRAGDPATLVAQNASAQKLLGWAPRLGLTEIVETAWQWTRKR